MVDRRIPASHALLFIVLSYIDGKRLGDRIPYFLTVAVVSILQYYCTFVFHVAAQSS